MSAMTDTGSPHGQAPAGPSRTGSGAGRGRGTGLRLRGMKWLIWRQHRAAYWTLLATTLVAVAVMVYERDQMVTYLEGYGWPRLKPGWEERFDKVSLGLFAQLIGFTPIVIGVFLGAPLLAGDLESGTAKLVTTQSASRVRWLTTKLGVTALVVGTSTAALSAAFTWWWSPVKSSSSVMDWSDGTAFDSSGPVPVGLTLLTLIGGVAIGMLLRRTLLSMVVTLGFAVAVQVVWSRFRMSLGDAVTVNTGKGVGDDAFPKLPDSAHVLDQSYVTSSGDHIGWGSCSEATEKATNACLDKAQVVGWHIEYIPITQMSSMQWLGTSLLLALTAGVTAFVVLWGRKRVV
jgi:ABC-type transport system involved in multi-copper enzyme maturation permease subunit